MTNKNAIGAMQHLAEYISAIDPQWKLAGGFGRLEDPNSGHAATREHMENFIEWKAKAKDEILADMKESCPKIAGKYVKGCGNSSDSLKSTIRQCKIGLCNCYLSFSLLGFISFDRKIISVYQIH